MIAFLRRPFILHFSLLIATSLLVTACSKDEETVAPADPGTGGTANTAANTTPVINGADGALFAVSTVTTQEIPFFGTIQIDINTGLGVFYDDGGAQINAGTVSCNDSVFSFTNNAYFFQPLSITGIDYSSGVNWNVTGGNGIPAFTRSITAIPFPSVDTVSSATTIDRSADYTLTVTGVSGADSVYFTVGSVLKRMGPNASTCTFTAAELGTQSAGYSIAQVAAFNYYPETIGGKTIYFGNERVMTRSVTLQ